MLSKSSDVTHSTARAAAVCCAACFAATRQARSETHRGLTAAVAALVLYFAGSSFASAQPAPEGGINANREQMIEFVLKLHLPQGEDGQALGANP